MKIFPRNIRRKILDAISHTSRPGHASEEFKRRTEDAVNLDRELALAEKTGPVLGSPDAQMVESKQRALRLSEQLFAGFEDVGLKNLQALLRASDANRFERSCAAWTLARWYSGKNEPETVLRLLHLMRVASPDEASMVQPTVLLIDTLLECDEPHSALTAALEAHRRLGNRTEIELMVAKSFAAVGDYVSQMDWLSRSLVRRSLSHLEAPDASLPMLNTLKTSCPANQQTHDHMVSVIMPVRNAAATITFAAESVLAQTWSNLELIIVDDASSDDTWKVIQTLSRKDPRIKPIHLEKRRGAYAGRNAGLAVASAPFSTTHDADDWSHPQKIEVQMNEILKSEQLLNSSSAVSVDETIRVIRRPVASHLISQNYSSMLTKTEIIRDLGGWDEVSCSADKELMDRIKLRYGSDLSKVLTGVPLSLLLTSPESLTRRPVTGLHSLRYGSRREYHESSEYWHSRNVDSLSLNASRRPFPVPKVMLFADETEELIDTVFVDDYSDCDVETVSRLWRLSRKSGSSLGWLHLPSLQNVTTPVAADVRELAVDLNARAVVAGEPVRAKTLVVIDAKCCLYRNNWLTSLCTDNGIILDDEIAKISVEKKSQLEGVFEAMFGVVPRFATLSVLGGLSTGNDGGKPVR